MAHTQAQRSSGGSDPALIGVLALGLLLRGGLVVLYPSAPLWKDEILHYATGVLVAALPQPVLGHWPPGYELLLAGVFRLFGPSPVAVRWVQVALSTLLVGLVYGLAGRAGGRRAARWAGLLCAIYPSLVAYSSYLYAETLFTTLLVAAIWVLHRSPVRPSAGACVAAGLLFGLAALTRSAALYFLPVWLLWLVWQRQWLALRRAALVAGVALATVVPWTLRNALVYHDFLLIDGAVGRTLWWAYNESPYHVDLGFPETPHSERRAPCEARRHPNRPLLPPWEELRKLYPPEQLEPRTARALGRYVKVARGFAVRDVPAFQRCEVREALRFIALHPGVSLRRVAERVYAFWGPNSFLLRSVAWQSYAGGPLDASAYAFVRAGVLLSYIGIVLLALLGFGRRSHSELIAWIGLFALYWATLHALALATSRYRLPLMPLLIVPAATWLASPGWPETRARRLAVGLGAAGFGALCIHYVARVLPW